VAKKPARVAFNTYLQADLKERFTALARERGVSVADLLEGAIETALAGVDNSPQVLTLARLSPDERVEHTANCLAWIKDQIDIHVVAKDGQTAVLYSAEDNDGARIDCFEIVQDGVKDDDRLQIRVVDPDLEPAEPEASA
jgi:hypothetical protein